jgi:hypothetical protein
MANIAKNAVAKAQAKAKAAPKAPAKAAPEKPAPKAAPEASTVDKMSFVGKTCKIMKGKHKDKTCDVFFVSKRKDVARCILDGEQGWINTNYLEIAGDMDAKAFGALKAQQDAEAQETLYISAQAVSQTDNGVSLKIPGWFKRFFFATANEDRDGMIFTTNATDPENNGLDIFEVVAWKIKREAGMDTYDKLKADQARLEKLVEAAG